MFGMAIKKYRKLFYDLDAAKSFGREINSTATTPEFMVPAGASQHLRPVFGMGTSGGDYFFLDEERGSTSKQPVYYINYRTRPPARSGKADTLVATRNAIAHLEEKYAELGPSPHLGASSLGR